jgi:hypothetical protein
VSLKIFDILGKEIATLVDEIKPAGIYILEFNAGNLPGGKAGLASGVYFCKMQTYPVNGDVVNFSDTKKIILIK